MMSAVETAQARQVADFDRVSLSVINVPHELTIRQGDHESLVLEGEPEVLSRVQTEVRGGELSIRVAGSWADRLADALATSLTRKHVRCTLTVKNLKSLETEGAVRVHIPSLDAEQLSLRLKGVSDVRVRGLTTGLLDVSMSGPGGVEVAGQALEQRVVLTGPSSYAGGDLQSKRASVQVDGPASAALWVTDDLDIKVGGIASVEYYGTPKVRQRVSGMASVRALGSR